MPSKLSILPTRSHNHYIFAHILRGFAAAIVFLGAHLLGFFGLVLYLHADY
jgi:hypothetical protein